jgi:hypothetical protein
MSTACLFNVNPSVNTTYILDVREELALRTLLVSGYDKLVTPVLEPLAKAKLDHQPCISVLSM